MNKSKNKRRSVRVDCTVPVEGKKDGIFDHTLTTDISKGGLGFISNHKIPLGKKIPIEIALDSDGETVFVIGKVVWCVSVPDAGTFRVGIKFDEVLSGSKSRLNRFFKK